MPSHQKLYNVDSDSYTDNYVTYTKKDKTKVNNFYYISIIALGLSISSIGLATQTYNNYRELKRDYNHIIHEIDNNNNNYLNNMKNLAVDSYVRTAISGHPYCYNNYSDCMNLIHLSSLMATHNGTISEISDGYYHYDNRDAFLLSPEHKVIANGPAFNDFNFDSENFQKWSIMKPQDCDHYLYGTCIFTHNNTLMTYTHVYLNEHYNDDNIMRRNTDDFFSYGASGAGMGSAIGGGVGAVVGPEGIPVGAAIGGAVGAIVGATVGAFQ
jgi:hypothetical protein